MFAMTLDLRAAKQRQREAARSVLARLNPEASARASMAISRAVLALPEAASARRVMVYLSAAGAAGPTEPDLSGLIAALRERGVTVCAPRMGWNSHTMDAVPLVFGEGNAPRTEVRRHGVPEPVSGPMIAPEDLSLVLVPGLAFDASRGRLGRGAGFYDRWLGALDERNRPAVVGVCFDAQLVDDVPMDAHDVRMDIVVTDARVVRG